MSPAAIAAAPTDNGEPDDLEDQICNLARMVLLTEAERRHLDDARVLRVIAGMMGRYIGERVHAAGCRPSDCRHIIDELMPEIVARAEEELTLLRTIDEAERRARAEIA